VVVTPIDESDGQVDDEVRRAEESRPVGTTGAERRYDRQREVSKEADFGQSRYQGVTSRDAGGSGRFVGRDEVVRFWDKVDRTTGCWLWTSVRTADGYGHFRTRVAPGHHRYVKAHRWAYEQSHGPIPDGLTVDHLCRNRACVRPDHLEAVSITENIRRAAAHRQATKRERTTP